MVLAKYVPLGHDWHERMCLKLECHMLISLTWTIAVAHYIYLLEGVRLKLLVILGWNSVQPNSI